MSRAVLFCNGEIDDIEFHKSLLRSDDFIIAVDGGGEYCYCMDIVPAVAIGDFDSLTPKVLSYFDDKGVERISFPADKDFIDMVLGIEEAKKRGYQDILLLGAMGGKRADMFLGNALSLSAYDENVVMKNEWTEIRFVKTGRTLTLQGKEGDYLSILPLSETLLTGKSFNLKYQLDKLVFHRGETRSISNEFLTDSVEITVEEGEALVIIQKR